MNNLRKRLEPWLVALMFTGLLIGVDILLPFTFYGQMVVVAFGVFAIFIGWPSHILLRLSSLSLVAMIPLVIIQHPASVNSAVYAFLWLGFGVVQNVREYRQAIRRFLDEEGPH